MVQHKDPDGDDVGVTQVVDEPADVAIVTGIDAVYLSILRRGQHASHPSAPFKSLPTDHPVPPPQLSIC